MTKTEIMARMIREAAERLAEELVQGSEAMVPQHLPEDRMELTLIPAWYDGNASRRERFENETEEAVDLLRGEGAVMRVAYTQVVPPEPVPPAFKTSTRHV